MVLFDNIISREGTSCVKYDLRKKVFGREDVIPLWVADMDFAVPVEISKALHERISHGIFGYSFRNHDFSEVLSAWLLKRHGLAIKEEWVSFSPGIVSALVLLLESFTKPGDKIIVQPPVYPPFFEVVQANHRQVIWNPIKLEQGRYVMDFEDLSHKASEAKMIFLSNPHNPVGRAWHEDELRELAMICAKHQIIMVSDEIHSDIMLGENKHHPLLKIFPEAADLIVACYSPSKTFNLAGLSTSALVIKNPILRQIYNDTLERLHMQMGNVLGTVAFSAAYKSGENWLLELLDYLNGNLHFIKNFIKDNLPGIHLIEPEATYLAWLDFRSMGLDPEALNQKLIWQCGLGLSRGDLFGAKGEGFMRMNFATPRRIIESAVQRMKLLSL